MKIEPSIVYCTPLKGLCTVHTISQSPPPPLLANVVSGSIHNGEGKYTFLPAEVSILAKPYQLYFNALCALFKRNAELTLSISAFLSPWSTFIFFL